MNSTFTYFLSIKMIILKSVEITRNPCLLLFRLVRKLTISFFCVSTYFLKIIAESRSQAIIFCCCSQFWNAVFCI